MRIARFCILVFFVVLQVVRTSYSETLLTAQYNVLAEADGREPGLGPSKRQFAIGGLKDEPSAPFDSLSVEGFADAVHGGSVATIIAYANAEVGKIGIGIVGGVASSHLSDRPPLPFTGGGEAKVEIITLEAGWAEITKVRVPGKAPGTLLHFTANLGIDGEFNSDSQLGDFDFPGGQAEASLQVFERTDNYDLPPSPYPFGNWARLYDNPPLKIVEDVPGAVRVEYFMRVGQNFAFDLNFRLLGYARAVNGGTSSLNADFTGSLKWGGIESVTDMDGNLIPRDEWSIESESGFDYARTWDEQQVPEPSNVLLLGTALCLGALRRNRCHERPRPTARDFRRANYSVKALVLRSGLFHAR